MGKSILLDSDPEAYAVLESHRRRRNSRRFLFSGIDYHISRQHKYWQVIITFIQGEDIILAQDATMQRRMAAGLRLLRTGIRIINYATYRAKVIEQDGQLQLGDTVIIQQFRAVGKDEE